MRLEPQDNSPRPRRGRHIGTTGGEHPIQLLAPDCSRKGQPMIILGKDQGGGGRRLKAQTRPHMLSHRMVPYFMYAIFKHGFGPRVRTACGYPANDSPELSRV